VVVVGESIGNSGICIVVIAVVSYLLQKDIGFKLKQLFVSKEGGCVYGLKGTFKGLSLLCKVFPNCRQFTTNIL
jgi:hypothetical protein